LVISKVILTIIDREESMDLEILHIMIAIG